ncbi:hypothetical protein ACFS2C_24045 [Prauserella oleivorans]|uniref:Uncharacterized protein n=1 Tax=Prauserella oleivorans TaxID=1478153 RepID=A0ABW5WJ86_9PSEU
MQAITAVYVQDDEDYTVTVTGMGKELSGKAPGIIAARDRADQLVEKLAPEGENPTVVHLLNGSALEFTSVYMAARLARPEATDETGEEEQATQQDAEGTADKPAPAGTAEKADETGKGEPAAKSEPDAEAAEPESAATSPAPAEAAETKPAKDTTADQETTPKRGVPRKELSKTPEAAPAKDETTSPQAGGTGQRTEARYAATAAGALGGLPGAAGSASAAG